MKTIDEPGIKAAEIFRILGHPVRIQILTLLNRNTKMSVKQIHESLGLTQPETSRHLILMKKGMILKYEKHGSNTYYSVNGSYALVRSVVTCINEITEQNNNPVK